MRRNFRRRRWAIACRARGAIESKNLVLMPHQPSESSLNLPLAGALGARRRTQAPQDDVIQLFDELRGPLLRYLLAFGLPIQDGEEIVQEVFLALFRHLLEDKSRANLRGWIFRVAHNLGLKRCSGNRRNDVSAAFHITDPAPSPEEQLAATQTQQRLMAVVDALPDQDRRCLLLRAEGLRYREIAEVLEMSLGGVSISLTRSLARIARVAER